MTSDYLYFYNDISRLLEGVVGNKIVFFTVVLVIGVGVALFFGESEELEGEDAVFIPFLTEELPGKDSPRVEVEEKREQEEQPSNVAAAMDEESQGREEAGEVEERDEDRMEEGGWLKRGGVEEWERSTGE